MRKIANSLVGVALPILLLTGGLAYGGQGQKMQHGMAGEGHGQGMMAECPMMGGQGMSPGKGMMMDKEHMARLDLSDEQQTRMHEMQKSYMTDHKERRERMQDLRGQMKELMGSERPDPSEVEALHSRMAEHRGQMLADHVRMRNAMHDELTEEQKERMQKMKQQEPEEAAEADDDHDQHH